MNVVLGDNQGLTENQGMEEAVSFPLMKQDRSEYRIVVHGGAYPNSLSQPSIISNIFSQRPLPLHLTERKSKNKSVSQPTIIQQEA